MREKFEYITVKGLLWFSKWLPKRVLYLFFSFVSILFYYLVKSRRTLISKNISMVFPRFNKKQTNQFAKKVYVGLSQTATEILLMVVGRFDINSAVVNRDEAIQKLHILSAQKRGVIIVTAHYSNWELAAQFLAKNGFPMIAVGREGDNDLIDKNITLPFREKYGNKAVYKEKGMIAMAKALKNGENVGMLIDQKIGGTHSMRVPFFAHGANTTLSVASLKEKFNPLVVPISIVREARGKYRMFVDDVISYDASEIVDKKEKLFAMTKKYNEAIEKIILRSPEQWFWMHNRWKEMN